ncbi:MAG: hypothetical protein ACXVDD_20960 [Polyangia bacterium]
MLDVAQLERTLDLWASMWLAHERAQFERALERVVEGDAPESLKAAAVCACHVIGTPRLVGAATNASWALDRPTLNEIAAVAGPRARLLRHAARLAQDREGVRFLLDKIVREPENPVADKLLDRVDIRDLYAVMTLCFDDDVRTEAARRIARRGPHQRARLLAALDLPPDAFDDQLAVDVPLDDLGADDDAPADDAWLPALDVEIENGVSA